MAFVEDTEVKPEDNMGRKTQLQTTTQENGSRITGLAAKTDAKEVFTITPPKLETLAITIRGVAPYVQHAFSQKARQLMHEQQEQGSQGKKGKKREAKNFQECYEQAQHRSVEGWSGIPAPCFRNAMIDACRLVGFKMTHAKLGAWCEADGFDRVDASPLVRITKGEPRYCEHAVRLPNGSVDLRARAMFDPGWEALIRITFDADMFSRTDIMNLMHRVGIQVGIGEGRPCSKNSAGQGWGLFMLV